MGIDPGLAVVGVGIIGHQSDKICFIDSKIIKTPKNIPLHLRLLQIHDNVCKYCQKHLPDSLALEEVFFYRNSKSVMDVGRVEGVILTAAAKYNISIFYYSPQQIKRKLVGFGRATKEQIQHAVSNFLNMDKLAPQHISDALAVAICHLLSA